MPENSMMFSRYAIAKELRKHKEALQYFVDTFGGPEKWTAPDYMQVHRGEALKLAKELGIVPKQNNNDDERMISSISNGLY